MAERSPQQFDPTRDTISLRYSVISFIAGMSCPVSSDVLTSTLSEQDSLCQVSADRDRANQGF